MTDRHTVDSITSDALDALYDELARLHEGEEPVTDPRVNCTPGQWIWVWNRATLTERHRIVTAFLDDAATASLCRFNGHVQRLDEDRHAWVKLARVRDVIADMETITGARHWARILRKAVDGDGPGPQKTDTTQPEPACQPACAEQHTYDWNCALFAGIDDTRPACGSGCAEGHTYGFRCEQQGGPTTTEATEPAAPFSYEERERTGRNAGLVIPTNPAEHCGHRMPAGVSTASTECVLRPGHTGSHADDRGARWWYDPEDIDWRQRADQLAATLREALDTFTTVRRDDGVIAGHLLEGAIHPDDMNRWRAALEPAKEQH